MLDGLERRRRRWSQDDKARIVEETLVPGAKHGQFTKDAIEAHKLLRALLQQSRKLVQDIE